MKRLASFLLIIGLLLIVAPARAAEPEPITQLPTIAPATSGRMDFALAINATVDGEAVQALAAYGKGEFVQGAAHVVAVSAADNGGVDVAEVVVIGNRAYVRMNDDKRWQVTDLSDVDVPVDSPAAPTLPPAGVTMYRIGDATVRDTLTTQYQLQVDPSVLPSNSGITSLLLDLFIGKTDSYLHKFQTTVGATDKDIGPFTIEIPVELYDFNATDIVVGPPDPSLVDEAKPTTAKAYNGVAGASEVPAWARPFIGARLAELRGHY
jgi:hypothetical protein